MCRLFDWHMGGGCDVRKKDENWQNDCFSQFVKNFCFDRVSFFPKNNKLIDVCMTFF